MTERPGGGLAVRPLHLFWILDTSGSMAADGKIQALNSAIREATPHLRDVNRAHAHAQVLVRVVTFATGARWHVADPTPVESFTWTNLNASGFTDVGEALTLVTAALKVPPMDRRAFPPVLILVSDGQATDDFDGALAGLLAEPWGRRAVRTSIALGRDADVDMLRAFASDPARAPLPANNPEQLVRMIRFASTAAASSATAGVDSLEAGGVTVPSLRASSELDW
jgi:uncharacterized protein YegL